MAKIKAVLDQETWVEIDVPEEFQSIVNVLFASDALTSEDLDHAEGDNSANYDDAVTNNDVLPMAVTGELNAEQQVEQTNSVEVSADNAAVEKNRAQNRNLSAQSNNTDMKDHKKSASLTLFYNGVNYHMVNWLVFLIFLFLLALLSVSFLLSLKSLQLHFNFFE